MYWKQIDEQSIFTHIPSLEPMFGVYSLLQGEKTHQLCTEIYGGDQVAAWKEKYCFLFEIYRAIEQISSVGMIELLLDLPLHDFSLSAFEKLVMEMPAADFVFKYLCQDGMIELAQLQLAMTDDDALNRIYQKTAGRCSSFLGFSALVRQSKRYIQEFFSLVNELRNEKLETVLSSMDEKIRLMEAAIVSEVQEIGPFECSQLRMGKIFYNRGPYSEFYFIPSLLVPWRAIRFFHVTEEDKRQILFLSLKDVERSKEDILCSLKALSDSTRYRILTLLAQGTPMRGMDIAKRLSIAPSTVSHHMEQLKEGGLVTEEPVKNSKYYGICKPNVEVLLRELEKDFKIK